MHKSDIEQTRLRLKQEALRAEKTQRPVAGRFLAGEEIPLAGAAAKEAGVQLYTSSGWAAGERVQPCFVPEDEEPAFSLCWLEIAWAGKFQRLAHSDLLGSLMALGIDRSWFGDLVMQGDKAYLCALP